MGPEGVQHVEQFPAAITIALKETSLTGARVYIGGSGSNDKDIKEYAASDLLIVAIAAFVLIFLIMLFLTRSLMAALVIPGTVAFSYAGAFGLSILVWQHLIGLPLHWLVLPLTFIILVAVGSDYNLLLIVRVKEELHAGIRTRSHPRARKHRWRGDVRGFGVRVHHAGDAHQRSQNDRSGGIDGMHRPATRHADSAFVRGALHPADSSGRGSGGQRWCVPVRLRR